MQNAIETATTKATVENWGALVGLVIRQRNAGTFDDETADTLQLQGMAGAVLAACRTNTVNSNIYSTIEDLTAQALNVEAIGQIIKVRSVLIRAIDDLQANGWAGDMVFWGSERPGDRENLPNIAAEIAGALYQCCAICELTDLMHNMTKLAYWN